MSRQLSDVRWTATLGLGVLLGSSFGGLASASEFPPPADVAAPIVASETPADETLARQDVGRPSGGMMRPGFGAGIQTPGTELTREQIEKIDAELLENILLITDPTERSLALVQAARYKIVTRELETARTALDRAAESIEQMTDPVRRDLRLISTSKTFVELAQESINAAVSGVPGILSLEQELSPEQRIDALRKGLDAFTRANELAARIGSIGYRPQTMYFAAEQQALGGQAIGVVAFRNPGRLADQPDVLADLRRISTDYIDRAASFAHSIDAPVWRDVTLSAITSAAANSNQFALARQIARSVPELEIRFQALLTVAEAEVRRGSADQATTDYAEAARTVASIPIADLRSTLNNVLVESLIAAGRFPDARRCIVFYPTELDRLEALGAVAESMGSRGLSNEARDWIFREVRPEYRDQLFRRVNDGVLSTLERYGNDSYLGQDARAF
ncbi:hypothetical protein [Tautonia marina]|uniref:hypothetical protein n=1 Tax=Tautonia marina TaxID=2653855 RepID=UPI0012609E03|nr:hypothetical protein [Tautonia marina]